MKLTARTDRHLIRAAAQSVRYLLATVAAPRSPRAKERPGVHVAFVLDRSGSMGGEKIRLAKEAVKRALMMLDERDRFSLVFYDDRIDVVVPSTAATQLARREAVRKLDEVDARGSTDMTGGWFRGVEQIATHTEPGLVQRVLLLTDGLANVGIVDHDEIERHVAEIRARGISTTTFGIGADFDEHLLQRMSTSGGGNFYFIETAKQIPDFLTSELGEALEIVARDVRIVIEGPAGLAIEPMTPVAQRHANEGIWSFAIGDLVSRQELDVLFKIEFPVGKEGEPIETRIRVLAGDGELSSDAVELRWTYAGHGANDEQPRDREIDRKVAAIYAARARQEALELNRAGQFDAARALLVGVGDRIRSYAGDDDELNRMAHGVVAESDELAAPMAAMERKTRHFASYSVMRDKDVEGKARRRKES